MSIISNLISLNLLLSQKEKSDSGEMEAADLLCDEWMGPDGPVDREHQGAKPVLMDNGSFSTVATVLIDDSNGAVPHRLVNSFNIANNEGNKNK